MYKKCICTDWGSKRANEFSQSLKKVAETFTGWILYLFIDFHEILLHIYINILSYVNEISICTGINGGN